MPGRVDACMQAMAGLERFFPTPPSTERTQSGSRGLQGGDHFAPLFSPSCFAWERCLG